MSLNQSRSSAEYADNFDSNGFSRHISNSSSSSIFNGHGGHLNDSLLFGSDMQSSGRDNNGGLSYTNTDSVLNSSLGSYANGNSLTSSQITPGGANLGSTTTRNVPVKYTIYWDKQSSAFTVTLIVPVPTSRNSTDETPFQKVNTNSSPSRNEQGRLVETHALRVPLSYLLNLSSQNKSKPNQQEQAPWLDRNTLRSRINDGGQAIGLVQTYTFQTMAAVEETAIKLPQWCPRSTENMRVEIFLSEGVVTLFANVSAADQIGDFDKAPSSPTKNEGLQSLSSMSPRQNFNVLNESGGGLLATAPSFPPPMRNSSVSASSHDNAPGSSPKHNNSLNTSFLMPRNSEDLNKVNDNKWQGDSNNNNSFNSSSWGTSFSNSWGSIPGRMNNGDGQQQQNLSMNTLSPGKNLDRPLTSNIFGNNSVGNNPSYFDSQPMKINNDSNLIPRDQGGRPDPSIIIGPLLKMGFSNDECQAAVNAIRNLGLNNHSLSINNQSNRSNDKDSEESSRQMQQKNESDEATNNAMQGMSIGNTSSKQGVSKEAPSSGAPNSVWGNAGKLKIIKIPNGTDGASEGDDVTIDSEDKVSMVGSGAATNRMQKMVKVLEIPPDVNAFVFHCNAQTREECLTRGLFG